MNDPQRKLIYDKIWERTQILGKQGRPPKPYQNIFDQFDLNLVSGHKTRLTDKSDFTDQLMIELAQVIDELKETAPFMSALPIGSLHLTVFPLYLDKPQKFFTDSTFKQRSIDYQKVSSAVRDHEAPTVSLEGLLLTEEGTLIACGFDPSGDLDLLRTHLNDLIPDDDRRLPKLAHITLARLKENIAQRDFGNLIQWVHRNRNRRFRELSIRNPILVATRDREGLVPHEECEEELREFFKNKMPRIKE